MERLTQWYDDGKIRGVLVKDGYEENSLQTIITKIDECYAAVALLKEYEDTGLTPEQIRELKESVQRLDKIFGDEITVDQVIDFFVDFYIAQGDPDRVEAAELLTNEEVARYKALKERDTAKAVDNRTIIQNFSGTPLTIMGDCPSCGCENIKSCNTDFCPACGQRLKWEED